MITKKVLLEKVNQFVVSSRIDGIPFLFILFLPLCYNYWNQLDYDDIVFLNLSCVGFIYGMLINNYYDFENDYKHKPQKIGLNKKELGILTTIFGIIYIGLNILLSFLSETLNVTYPLGAFCTYCLVTAYTPILKPIPFMKNVSTAMYVCFIPIYVFVKKHSESSNALIISLPFSLLILIREILLDINDIEEDKSDRIVTLPILFGKTRITTYLKILVALFWIVGIAFRVVSIDMFPCQVGLISSISAYALHRIDCEEDREFACASLYFYLIWNIILNKDTSLSLMDAFMGICIILYIILTKNYSINPNSPKIWNVFCRKLVHMGVGCLALSLEPITIAYIVIGFFSIFRNILPTMSLGIEKRGKSLIQDTGIKCWLMFLFIWSVQNANNSAEVYQKALPFFISDPAAAMVGRTTGLSNKIFIWNEKTLQGSLMVLFTVYALRRSIILALGIGFAELFGGEYDNGLIGGILLINLYFNLEVI
tara:strand:+ start:3720 stop:5165 length:1446 start_codon:yes stop_codon:yes gene_type:complete